MPSISAMAASATGVGVPHTAAEGCSAAASSKLEVPGASARKTPVTSLAKCMTLGRCNTNGASGTFIESHTGSKTSATERTEYSCSSRSFDDRARRSEAHTSELQSRDHHI